MMTLIMTAALAGATPCDPLDTVRQLARSADTRDVAAAETLLHPAFRVVFSLKGSEEAVLMPREAWIASLSSGAIGGVPRRLTPVSTQATPGLSTVSVVLEGASGRFDSTYTVVRTPTGCQVAQEALIFTPPAGR